MERDPFEQDSGAAEELGTVLTAEIPPDVGRQRLDKALADVMGAASGLSRSRLRALIEDGQVSIDGETMRDPGAKARPGAQATVRVPPPAPARPMPEAIPINIVFEDAHLVVVDKPAGMAVHPSPGHDRGTLVNALLAHCGDSLSGVGGEIRPGVVHRIDKDTSGLLVAAKSDPAHQGLAAQFAAHDLERSYLALCWGAPDRGDPRLMGMPAVSAEEGWLRIDAAIARHRTDRKRMAVTASGGRRAVTWVRVVERFGAAEAPAAKSARPVVSAAECRLETGRTHQIRVHLSHAGHSLVGDPVYGRPKAIPAEALPPGAAEALTSFPRQALHAATLGFAHPITGEQMRFSSPPPADFHALLGLLRGEAG